MAQIFPRYFNILHFVLGAAKAGGVVFAVFFVWYYFSPKYTDAGYQPDQPVPFSHKLHAGDLGMDCRYCHTNVEIADKANVPPTQTCMNCHQMIKPESEKLALVRESWETGKPIDWIRIHNLPDYAYFSHSAHVRAGVGCASCHGRIDRMEVVKQVESLSMGWCLQCHRDPDPHLRDLSVTSVTDMDWEPPVNQRQIAAHIKADLNLNPSEDCSACHR